MQTPFFSAPPPSFLPCRKTRGPKKKKKKEHGRGITRRLRGHLRATGWKLFGPLPVTIPRLWEFLRQPSLSPPPFFCFYCYRRQRGFKEVAWVFVESPRPPPLPTRQRKLHRRDDPGRFSLSFSFPFFFRPPRTFSLILEPRALRGLEIGLGNWPRLIKRVLRARRGEREGRRFYCA